MRTGEFYAKTKRILASRVGYRCSNPDCKKPTSGPAQEEDESVNIGVAAHITAAASRDLRYDDSLTPEQRGSTSNGIWLCQNCAKLIDSDIHRYNVELLRQWKEKAEKNAFAAISTSKSNEDRDKIVSSFIDELDQEFLQSLELPNDDIDAVVQGIRKAAIDDLAAYRNVSEWPTHELSLALTIRDGEKRHRVTLDSVAQGVSVAQGLSLVSPPGTGKSTTLVQIADRILTAGQIVPLLIPLGEWSDHADDFFNFMIHHYTFRSFRREHFMQLAYFGKLTLLLDGWNELDPDSRVRAIRHIQALRREFPMLGVLIATRTHIPSFTSTFIKIEPLSENQQLELARAVKGDDGEALLDKAWRVPGLRELISIPLYLQTLLDSMPTGDLPKTKEEILRMFVERHEQVPDKAEILLKEVHGTHEDMLVGLAVKATSAANTTISQTQTRSTISEVANNLVCEGQLAISPQPNAVIDVLVNNHVLVRSSLNSGGVSFQHQQFQEWFASFKVEDLMRKFEQGDSNARKELRVEILNWPAWEEAILFACERLSRDQESGPKTVAMAIAEALMIDPILAAEMIHRATPEVWLIVKDDVISFCERWHTPGTVDRAVRFMITTGRPDFARHVWPLVSHASSQIHYDVLSVADRFRPAVLGDDPEQHLRDLPEHIRNNVISEIASKSGFDGIELATKLALTEPSPGIVVEIIQALYFRRADQHVHRILKSASDAVWKRLAAERFPEELSDPDLNTRLLETRQIIAKKETDPLKIIVHLAQNDGSRNAERIAELIQKPNFPIERERTYHAIRTAIEVYPEEVTNALTQRITEGLDLPYGVAEFLVDAIPVDEGPIPQMVYEGKIPEKSAREAYSVLGPAAVGRLMDRVLELNQELEDGKPPTREAEREEFNRLSDAILASRQSSFFIAMKVRARTDRPRDIQLMADLFAQHGRKYGTDSPDIIGKERDELVVMVLDWINVMLTSPDANRHQFVNVVRVADRLGDSRFVPGLKKMLERDLSDQAHEQEEYLKAEPNSHLRFKVRCNYTLQYRRAFAAIGGSEVCDLMKQFLLSEQFGFDAACVLVDVWKRENSSAKESHIGFGRDFSGVKKRRKQREESAHEIPTCDSAEAIFAVAEEYGAPEGSDTAQQYALRLAAVALSIPHGSKREVVDRLLALPQPSSLKQVLLRSAAIVGEVLPASVLLAGVKEFLEMNKNQLWRLHSDNYELMEWIELFAFSDRLSAVLEALELLPDQLRELWQLHGLFVALSNSPKEDVVDVLLALEKQDPKLLNGPDWWRALSNIGTEEASHAILEVICERSTDCIPQGIDGWQISEILGELASEFSAFRDVMICRYQGMSACWARDVLETAFTKAADEKIILAMVHNYALEDRPYDGGIAEAIQNVAIDRQPVEGWPNSYKVFSTPLKDLREALFKMIVENKPESKLAEACLTEIDKQRDKYGRVEDEPRHPDIVSDKAWPLAAEAYNE